jgi:hypothetical protein
VLLGASANATSIDWIESRKVRVPFLEPDCFLPPGNPKGTWYDQRLHCVQLTTRYRPVPYCYMNEWLRTAMVFLQSEQSRNFG